MTDRIWLNAVVEGIVDGDSYDVRVSKTVEMDFGFGLKPTMTLAPLIRMRLNRVNAPPGYTDAGKATIAMVKKLTVFPLTAVTMRPYKYGGPADSPGEWMVELTTRAGVNLSDALVAAGVAVYWDGQGPRPGGLTFP